MEHSDAIDPASQEIPEVQAWLASALFRTKAQTSQLRDNLAVRPFPVGAGFRRHEDERQQSAAALSLGHPERTREESALLSSEKNSRLTALSPRLTFVYSAEIVILGGKPSLAAFFSNDRFAGS